MSEEEETIAAQEKYGRCGHLIPNMNFILEHTCFEDCDEEPHFISIDKNHIITKVTEEVVTQKMGKSHQWNNDWDKLLIKAESQRLPPEEKSILFFSKLPISS